MGATGGKRIASWTDLIWGQSKDARMTLATSIVILVATVVGGIIVARVLGPDGKGDLARFLVISTLALDVAIFGGDQAITVLVAQAPHKRTSLIRSLRSAMRLQVMVGILIYLVLASLAGPAVTDLATPLLLFATLVLVEMYMVRGRAYLLGRGLYRRFNLTRITAEAFPVLVFLFLATVGWLTLVTAAFSHLISRAGAWCIAAKSIRNDLEQDGGSVVQDVALTAKFWSFSRRNFVSGLAAHGNRNIDLILLSLLAVPSSDLGEYSVATSAGMSIAVVGGSFGMIAIVRVAEAGDGTSPWSAFLPILLTASTLAGVGAAILWVLVPALIPMIYGEAFSEAVSLAQLLAIGGFFLSTSLVLSAGLKGMNRPGSVAVSEVVGVCVTALGVMVLGTQNLILVAGSAVAGLATTVALQSTYFVLTIERSKVAHR